MKKMIFPTFITIILIYILFFYLHALFFRFLFVVSPPIFVPLVLLIAAIMVGIIFILIHNLHIRIKEIRKDDKDDLSKY